MEKVYHFTSEKNWRIIQQTQALEPRSEGFHFEYIPEGVLRTLGTSTGIYLTALQNPKDVGWIKSGLFPLLMEHTTGEVILEVPIIEKRGAFVRDHFLNSPRAFLDEFGKDLYSKVFDNSHKFKDKPEKKHKFSKEEDQIIGDIRQRYLNSTVLLGNYGGNYKAPELWLSQRTPIELIRRIAISQIPVAA